MPRYQLSTLPKYALATLPSAVGLPTGTSYEITDYAGNIAVAANNVWRFEFPFRTTWAGRPAVGLVPAGTELQVTDYSNQKFISDGTVWRPAHGRMQIAQKHGPIASPVAVLSALTSGVFSLPGGPIVIPADMVPSNSRITVSALMRKTGASGSVFFGARLGKTGTTGDAALCGMTSNAATGAEVSLSGSARVSTSSANNFIAMNTLGDGVSAAVTNVTSTSTTNVDHTVDQYLSLIVLAGNVADTYNLLGYVVGLEA